MRSYWYAVAGVVLGGLVLAVLALRGELEEDPSAALAAAAALVAAGVVAWQSHETRRSARASERAAAAAVEALRVAQDALDVARDEERHSDDLVRESIRARIDASTPSITVMVGPAGRVTRAQASPFNRGRTTIEPGETLYLASEGDQFIGVEYPVTVFNESDRHVVLEFEIAPCGGGEFERLRKLVRPREAQRVSFEAWHMLGKWVSHEAAEQGLDGHDTGGGWRASCFSVSSHDQQDTGASSYWHVRTVGSPLAAVPGQTDAYRLADDLEATLRAEVVAERAYFASRREGRTA